MNQQLLEKLRQITEEEKQILESQKVQKSNYTENPQFIIESKKLLDFTQDISIRTHTRFIDFPLHKHNYIEIMYVCSGSITHIIDGKEVCLNQGEILLLNQHSWHEIKKAEIDDIAINLIILPEFFDRIYTMIDTHNIVADFLINILRQDTNKKEYLVFKVSNILQIQNLMENIIVSLYEDEKNMRNENQITMGLLFMYLVKYVNLTSQSTTKKFDELLVENVIDYITKNYKNATLAEIANQLNQPDYTLSRLIKKHTQRNFKDLLQSRRFYRAEELLIETELPIQEIINAVGYENSSYFFKRFKNKYGMTPNEFRKQRRSK